MSVPCSITQHGEAEPEEFLCVTNSFNAVRFFFCDHFCHRLYTNLTKLNLMRRWKMLSCCYHCLLWPEGCRVTRRPRLIISYWRATEEGKHPPWKGGTPTDPIPLLASHLCSRLLLSLNQSRIEQQAAR